jgi:hypothetical protein
VCKYDSKLKLKEEEKAAIRLEIKLQSEDLHKLTHTRKPEKLGKHRSLCKETGPNFGNSGTSAKLRLGPAHSGSPNSQTHRVSLLAARSESGEKYSLVSENFPIVLLYDINPVPQSLSAPPSHTAILL